MSVEELARALPRAEKLRLMESLWNDLSRDPELMESPAWHGEVLTETESRLTSGEETVFDWSEAKRMLLERR